MTDLCPKSLTQARLAAQRDLPLEPPWRPNDLSNAVQCAKGSHIAGRRQVTSGALFLALAVMGGACAEDSPLDAPAFDAGDLDGGDNGDDANPQWWLVDAEVDATRANPRDAATDIAPPPIDMGVATADAARDMARAPSDMYVAPPDMRTDPDPPDVPIQRPEAPASTVRFMWPIDAWVAANHNYYMRGVHSGSADLAAQYGTPVAAARGGRVTYRQWTERGGNTLIIDHGNGYTTLYSHLIAAASVGLGERVTTGQIVGALGRTGNAFSNGAHLHFAIRRNGSRLVVPNLDYGRWVQRGEVIAGSYSLSTTRGVRQPATIIATSDGASLFAEPSQSSSVVGNLAAGTRATVKGSTVGYYYVEASGGRRGWVVHTATRPSGHDVRGGVITATSANVRSGPGIRYSRVSTLPNGRFVSIFQTRDDYHRVLYGLPAAYGWTHSSNVGPTQQFTAHVRSRSANVRSAPRVDASRVGSLGFSTEMRVLEERDGWYRIRHGDGSGWVAGWLTQGRR